MLILDFPKTYAVLLSLTRIIGIQVDNWRFHACPAIEGPNKSMIKKHVAQRQSLLNRSESENAKCYIPQAQKVHNSLAICSRKKVKTGSRTPRVFRDLVWPQDLRKR